MGEILVIAVIWVIVALIQGTHRGSVQQSRNIQTYQNQQPYQRMQQRQSVQRPAVQVQPVARQAQAEQMQQAAAVMSQKQKELKARLQQKYPGIGSAQPYQARPASQSAQFYQARQTAGSAQSYQTGQAEKGRPQNVWQTVTSGDILTRAAENVRENDGDLLEQEDFLAKVETLMITGYQSKLTYERDFLSEGLDLLNSYRIPDAMPEFTESEM